MDADIQQQQQQQQQQQHNSMTQPCTHIAALITEAQTTAPHILGTTSLVAQRLRSLMATCRMARSWLTAASGTEFRHPGYHNHHPPLIRCSSPSPAPLLRSCHCNQMSTDNTITSTITITITVTT